MAPKFSAHLTMMFTEATSLLERYSLAKKYNFTAVECAFPYEYALGDVIKAKKEANVQQVLINSYPGDLSKGELGMACIPGREAEFRDSIDKSIQYAKGLQCPRVHIVAGKLDERTDDHDRTYESNIRYAVDKLQQANLIAIIEAINDYSVPGYYMNSFEKAVSIIKKINSPNLKLLLDVFHLQILNGNLSRNIEQFLPYTGHVQIAQVPHRHEPDTAGEVDYDYIFKLLEKLGYDGWIGCEYVPERCTQDGLKWKEKYTD